MTPTERVRKWRKDNPDRYKAYAKTHYARTKEENKRKSAEYRERNKEALRAKKKAYYEKNKRKFILKARARRRSVKDELLPGEWEAMVEACGNVCIVPGCSNSPVTQDHVIPVSKGGRHHIGNLQPICQFHNDSKHTKETDYRGKS